MFYIILLIKDKRKYKKMEKSLDEDNFRKRLNRYIKVTGHVGGIATRLGVNKYLGFYILLNCY